ncbi:MAG: hypothetical protein WAN51_05675 [Alphaproteobacteria bacterium]
MNRIAFFLLVAATATACTSAYRWSKEGASSGEIEDARKACQEESRGYSFLDATRRSVLVPTARGERYSNIEPGTALREADIFGECMRAKGYSLSPRQGEE